MMEIETNLFDYWRLLKKRKLMMGITAVLIYSSVLVYTELQTPLYEAGGTVQFEPPGTGIIGTEVKKWDQWVAINTQVSILKSADMAERLKEKVGLGSDLPRISARHIKDSHLISISAVGPDPVLAADVVNAAIELYVEFDREIRSQALRSALEDIISRRDEIKISLTELEEGKRDYLEAHTGTGAGPALSSALTGLELRRRELLKKFTREHPEIVNIEERIRAIRTRLTGLPAKNLELERLTREIEVNKEIYIALSRQLEEKRVALSGVPSFVTPVSKVTVPTVPVYPDKRQFRLLGFCVAALAGMIVVFMAESFDFSMSTIEDVEQTVGVSVLGIIPHLESSISWRQRLGAWIGAKRLPIQVFRSLLLFNQSARSQSIESYHTIRSAIGAQNPSMTGWVQTFTSTGGDEGKTLTSINYCLAAAHAGIRTLLVGADVRRSDIHRVFGLPKQEGLMEVLAGKVEWRDTIQGVEDLLMGEMDMENLLAFAGIGNFSVMTSCATLPPDIISVFSSPRLNVLIKELRSQFGLVVFDCPPILPFSDGVLIGAQSDGVVMVYQSGKMARRALKRAKEQLVSGQAKILGVVLNDTKPAEMGPGYMDHYYGYYGYGHGDRLEEEDSAK